MPVVTLGPALWLVAAAGTALGLVGLAAKRSGGDRNHLDRLVLDILWAAVLGSRLIYALTDPVATIRQPARLLMLNGITAWWGALAGAAVAILYHSWRHQALRRPTRDGAILILSAVSPWLMLAWDPTGIPTFPAAAVLGPLHPVALYYAAAQVLVAVLVWAKPSLAPQRFLVLMGGVFVLIDNFRMAPLIGGLATSLQAAGAMALLGGLVAKRPTRDTPMGGNHMPKFDQPLRIGAAVNGDADTIVPLPDGPALVIYDLVTDTLERHENPGHTAAQDRRPLATAFLIEKGTSVICSVPMSFCPRSHQTAVTAEVKFLRVDPGTPFAAVVAALKQGNAKLEVSLPEEDLFRRSGAPACDLSTSSGANC